MINVYRKIIKNGVEIKIKNKKYRFLYPAFVWGRFPKGLHRSFADSLTYISTWHLPLVNKEPVAYHFPHPLIEPVFFKILTYSIPMNIFENQEIKTTEFLKKFYNACFQNSYRCLNYLSLGKRTKKILKKQALVLFSFGKESLLTYGLLKEMEIKTYLFFMREPQSTFENKHKKILAEKFYKKNGDRVFFFPISIGRLRQSRGFYWGWDIILSQYIFFLLPYFFAYQTRYVFLGNEQSCNFYLYDNEGYLINPVFEQSIYAMQHQQDIPKQFFINTHIGSLVEPIHELFITYILHHRYPEVGAFQISCFSENKNAKKKRWCGCCEKCARIYVFLRAFNLSPKRVGFYDNNMFSVKKESLYTIFNKTADSAYGGSGLGKEEQLLAFYLAYKNGAVGDLINKFKKNYLRYVEQKKERLINEFFGIHSSLSLPSELRKKIITIFKKEQQQALDYVYKIIKK